MMSYRVQMLPMAPDSHASSPLISCNGYAHIHSYAHRLLHRQGPSRHPRAYSGMPCAKHLVLLIAGLEPSTYCTQDKRDTSALLALCLLQSYMWVYNCICLCVRAITYTHGHPPYTAPPDDDKPCYRVINHLGVVVEVIGATV